ncbi:MAG: ion channel [Polyangiaceae bacterium]
MLAHADKAAVRATLDLLLRSLGTPGGTAPGGALSPGAARGGAPLSTGKKAPQPDALVAVYQGAKRSVRELATRDPIDALVSVVGAGTVLFYMAEKGKNPKCRTVWDALEFITTCLNVGYDDMYATTPAGKAISSFVMTVGPSVAARAFDAPRAETERAAEETAATQRAIVERLDLILRALKAGGPSLPSSGAGNQAVGAAAPAAGG